MNYGESLGYWYLRLNGFLPITNFVLHRPELEHNQNADCDILAVRFQFVFEEIGGQHDDWDNDRFKRWGLNHGNRTVAVIAEVKTGDYRTDAIETAFSNRRLNYAVLRLGLFPQQSVSEIVERLERSPFIEQGNVVIAKLVIDSGTPDLTQGRELRITLEEIISFIQKRIRTYSERKEAARMFFADPLMQLFASGQL